MIILLRKNQGLVSYGPRVLNKQCLSLKNSPNVGLRKLSEPMAYNAVALFKPTESRSFFGFHLNQIY